MAYLKLLILLVFTLFNGSITAHEIKRGQSSITWQLHYVFLNSHVLFADFEFNISVVSAKSASLFVYDEVFEISPRSYGVIHLKGLKNSDNFCVFQLHSFYFNVSISLDEQHTQSGTNLGFVITNKTSQTVQISNRNMDLVKLLVAVIVYNSSSPQPDRVTIRETSNFIIASVDVKKSSVDLTAYFTYLEANNFAPEAYFDGIRRMMNVSMTKEFKVRVTQ